MFNKNKKEKKEIDLMEIKQEIKKDKKQSSDIKKSKIDSVESVIEPIEEQHFAPLFIKLEKYEDVLNMVGSLKNEITKFNKILYILLQANDERMKSLKILKIAEDVATNGLNIFKNDMDNFNEKVKNLNSLFPKPKYFDNIPQFEERSKKESGDTSDGFDESLMKLQERLNTIKQEIQEI